MMHGHEKSDSVILAVKPVNKAEQPALERSAVEPTAAEPLEPRAETKGNAGTGLPASKRQSPFDATAQRSRA
jgi:hypothetical protein